MSRAHVSQRSTWASHSLEPCRDRGIVEERVISSAYSVTSITNEAAAITPRVPTKVGRCRTSVIFIAQTAAGKFAKISTLPRPLRLRLSMFNPLTSPTPPPPPSRATSSVVFDASNGKHRAGRTHRRRGVNCCEIFGKLRASYERERKREEKN